MDCCRRDFGTNPSEEGPAFVTRRNVLKGLVGTVAGFALANPARVFAQGNRDISLAFCSQLLCVVPYEFTHARGYFADEGLNVELVYTRGGNAAMQSLVGGAVDYAATSFDVALQAYSNNAPIRRFATTGRLPLFALAVSPQMVDSIREIGDLEGHTVGVSGLGNADHALMLFLLNYVGADANRVSFATVGVNLFDAVRLRHVDAGMVQEPALSLLQDAGATVLFNGMDIDDANRYLGGPYEFMGVAVRDRERAERAEEMEALSRALANGLRALKQAPVEHLVEALPRELIAGEDTDRLMRILEEYRDSLYPDTTEIDLDSWRRVQEAHLAADMLDAPLDLEGLLGHAPGGAKVGVG